MTTPRTLTDAVREMIRHHMFCIAMDRDATSVVCDESTDEIMEKLVPLLLNAEAMRDYIKDEGLGIDSSLILDCYGDKCRKPECVACFGVESVYEQPTVHTTIGSVVLGFDAAVARVMVEMK